MADTIFNTARGTGNIQAKQMVIDMSNEITLLEPKVSPLTVLTKNIGTETCSNYKFEWMEDDLMARWATMVTASVVAGTTSIAVSTGEGALIAVNDLLKVPATGEVLRVTAVSTDTLTVQRGYGETAAGSITQNSKMLIIGNAMAQGTGSPAEKATNVVPVYNYTQIIKTAFSVTNTLDATKMYGPKEIDRIRHKKGIEHAQSIEHMLLFGERKLDTSGAQPLTTSAGVFKFLAGTQNVQAISKATYTTDDAQRKQLDIFMEKLFTYGSGEKVALCSPDFITWMNGLAFGKLQLIQADKDKTFGLNVTQYVTPHGTLNMVQHPLLVQGYAGTAVCLDLGELSYRPLNGRDTTLKTDIQLPDEDGIRDMYITEAGLQLKQPKKHGILTITA